MRRWRVSRLPRELGLVAAETVEGVERLWCATHRPSSVVDFGGPGRRIAVMKPRFFRTRFDTCEVLLASGSFGLDAGRGRHKSPRLWSPSAVRGPVECWRPQGAARCIKRVFLQGRRFPRQTLRRSAPENGTGPSAGVGEDFGIGQRNYAWVGASLSQPDTHFLYFLVRPAAVARVPLLG